MTGSESNQLSAISFAIIIVVAGIAPLTGVTTAASTLPMSVTVPNNATAGEQVSINTSADIPELPGDFQSNLTMRLIIDGSTVDTQTITVTDGETARVNFTHTFTTTGSHNITVNGSITIGGTQYTNEISKTITIDPEPIGTLNLSAAIPNATTAGDETNLSATVSLPDSAGLNASGNVTLNVSTPNETLAQKTIE